MRQNATPATHASVHELAVALTLDEAAYRRAVELAGLVPDKRDWLRYLDRILIGVGALLLVAGVAAFFAWNWASLHHMAKFALLQAGIVAGVLIGWRLRYDSVGGRASLFAAAFFVGILLAVFGQVYQTGADPYGLFLGWSLLILPWAVAGRQGGLWLLIVVLLNLALIMYWTQVLYPPSGWWQLSQMLGPLVWLGTTVLDSRLASWLFALNAGALLLWEYGATRGIAWLTGRSAPRLLALAALFTVLAPTLVLIAGASSGVLVRTALLSPALFTAVLAAALWYYRVRKHDLFMLTAALFAAILVIMALATRYVFAYVFANLGSMFVLAALLIGLVAGAAYWLRDVARGWAVTP